MFRRMVDFTEPICQAIDSSLAGACFDTSGIELLSQRTTLKPLISLIRPLKAYYLR